MKELKKKPRSSFKLNEHYFELMQLYGNNGKETAFSMKRKRKCVFNLKIFNRIMCVRSSFVQLDNGRFYAIIW